MAKQTGKQVRYAVVGAGNLTQEAILPAFAHAKENSKVVALVTGDAQKRTALSERYGLETSGGYDQFEEILELARVDAVYLVVPNSLHREFTERAARKGVHVLCEKPMAETVEDCEAMIKVCAEHNVRLMIAYRLHFEEATLRAIELAKSGKLGDLKLFSSVFTQQVREGDIRTRADLAGGAIFDMGVYCINAARYLFRDEPLEVFATCVRGSDPRFDGSVDESTTAILRFAGGKVAQLSASLSAASTSTLQLVGSKGDLRMEPAYGYDKPLVHHLTLGGKTTTQSFEARDQFAPELITFSRAIVEGHVPEPSGQEGLADVRIVRAILESAETGKAVRLAPFLRDARPDLRQEIHKPPVHPPAPINAPAPTVSSGDGGDLVTVGVPRLGR
jgi:predicted dehydrogenase